MNTPEIRPARTFDDREMEVVRTFERYLRLVGWLTLFAAGVQVIGAMDTLFFRAGLTPTAMFRVPMHIVAAGLWVFVSLRLRAAADRLATLPAPGGDDLPTLFDGLDTMNRMARVVVRIVAVIATLVVLALLASTVAR